MFVNAVPSVLILNTVPLPKPPSFVVPYKVFPDTVKVAYGVAPSAPIKLCRLVNVCAVTRPVSINPRPAINTSSRDGFLTPAFIGWFCGLGRSYITIGDYLSRNLSPTTVEGTAKAGRRDAGADFAEQTRVLARARQRHHAGR